MVDIKTAELSKQGNIEPGDTPIAVSVGICAYNEANNIGHLLERLTSQKTQTCSIREMIVISSGSTDGTDDTVRAYCDKDPRIRLISQGARNGKPSAVNDYLRMAAGDVCILISADVLPNDDAVEKLTRPLQDPRVGFVGSHPIPVNDPSTFAGFMVHLYWRLHHLLALQHPKGGEMIAFRKVVRQIGNTASDEANIEILVVKAGYRLAYAPDAIVNNKGPETVAEYLKQRRRQNVGRIHLRETAGYRTATMDNYLVLKTLVKNTRLRPRDILFTMGALAVEFYGRVLAMYDWHVKKNDHTRWAMVATTKKLVND